ncbi:hypothetical protein AB0E69_30180 [Kribbella sp. NPDC026611]|uniref:hypothetical protein n=1 Tax=Kribbella sp. NPDC026611 TaxID=3154911 RepID=UPI0033D1EC48
MTAAEKITLWLAQVRASGRAVLLARLVIMAAGVVALVVSSLQPWDQMDLVPMLAAPMLVVTVVLPDSLAGLLFIVILTGGWLMRAPGEISWGLGITAAALVVVHLATAFTAQLPSYARVHRDALKRWWLPAAIAVLIVPTAAVAAAAVQGADVAGSLLFTVGALALATTAIWFAAGQKIGRD